MGDQLRHADKGRACFWVGPSSFDEERGGYVPSLVYEKIGGHYPMTGNGKFAEPWIWGDNIETAQKICDRMNHENLELSEQDVLDILLASIFHADKNDELRPNPYSMDQILKIANRFYQRLQDFVAEQTTTTKKEG
tara:strand:- start:389 stop:796 length:408 start_codon:yes stop_codon:yes gene_type:complete